MNTIDKVKQWFIDRDLENGGRLDKQSLKLSEEFGELCAGYLKKNEQLTKDSIGDCAVVKAFSQMLDNLFTFLKNLEVEIEKIERRRTQNVRQRTFQISKHSTHNRFKKARIRNQKSRCSKWLYCRNQQTYRNYRNQNRR